MKITEFGRFDIGHGYKCIVKPDRRYGYLIKLRYKQEKGLYEPYVRGRDDIGPIAHSIEEIEEDIGEFLTFPKPKGWSKEHDDFNQNTPVVCILEESGDCTWIQKNQRGWFALLEW